MKMRTILSEGVFEPTKEGNEEVAATIKLLLSPKVPIVGVRYGILGGFDMLFVTVGLQKKENWPGMFENSKYFRMDIDVDGTMEVSTANLTEKSKRPYMAYDRIPVKFRKTKAKSIQDACNKMLEFAKKVQDYYESIGFEL